MHRSSLNLVYRSQGVSPRQSYQIKIFLKCTDICWNLVYQYILVYVIILLDKLEFVGEYMKNLYIVGGTMGVGKTAVCQQLKMNLPNSVLLDGDWCWDASPFQVTDETKSMVTDNICYLLNNFLHCSAATVALTPLSIILFAITSFFSSRYLFGEMCSSFLKICAK